MRRGNSHKLTWYSKADRIVPETASSTLAELCNQWKFFPPHSSKDHVAFFTSEANLQSVEDRCDSLKCFDRLCWTADQMSYAESRRRDACHLVHLVLPVKLMAARLGFGTTVSPKVGPSDGTNWITPKPINYPLLYTVVNHQECLPPEEFRRWRNC